MEVFNELTILGCGYCILIFTDFVPHYMLKNTYGWIIIAFVMLNFGTNILFLVIVMFGELMKLCRKLRGAEKAKKEQSRTRGSPELSKTNVSLMHTEGLGDLESPNARSPAKTKKKKGKGKDKKKPKRSKLEKDLQV